MVCSHGQLARQCLLCEHEATITELRAKLAEANARTESLLARVEEATGAREAITFEDACARLDAVTATRLASARVIYAAKLWHRGETQPDESRNENGLVAAVEALLALEAETPEVK